MKKTRFTEAQIVAILKKHESGTKLVDLCREHGISSGTFYNWKAKYGGMEVSDVQKMKAMEEENTKLKKIVANLTLENYAIKDLLEKKF
jgi:putative transposase